MIALYITLCATLNRWRGSGHWPLNVKRAIISAALAAPVAISLPWHGLVLFFALWIAGFGMGWGSYFDFGKGRNDGDVPWIDRLVGLLPWDERRRDLLALSLRGLHFTVPLIIIGAWHLVPLGLLMGPVYYWFSRQEGDYIGPAELAWGAILGGVFLEAGLMIH